MRAFTFQMENTNPSEEQVGKLDAHLEGELCKIFDKMHAVEELHEQGVKIINDTKEDVMVVDTPLSFNRNI
jgi:hypothetical protein